MSAWRSSDRGPAARRGIALLVGGLTGAGALAVLAVVAAETRGVAIVSPREGMPVAGPVQLEAETRPVEAVAEVDEAVFFVDGRVVCRLAEPPLVCAWNAGRTIDTHLVRLVVRWRDGTRSVATVRTGALSLGERVDVDAVQLTVVVQDHRGRFVRGLAQEAFQVFQDGRPQTLAHFANERVPLEVVAAIDMSGSMTEAMPQVREAAARFLAALAPDHQVTVLAFNDNVFTLSRRGAAPEARRRALARLTPWGGTALYDAILAALDVLGAQQGRRALVVFTDGADQQSHATFGDVQRRVESSDATMYMIGQGDATTNPALRRLLERLAAVSGGRAFFEARPDALDAVFVQIIEELSSQYLLSYQPDAPVRDGEWHAIRVEVDRGEYRVRTRQGFRASPSPDSR